MAALLFQRLTHELGRTAVFGLLMQIKLVGSPLKQERDSNKDSIAIYNHVVSNETAVLNTVDNKYLVLIPSYDGTKPIPSRGSSLPIAIIQTMSGEGAINGKKARYLAPLELTCCSSVCRYQTSPLICSCQKCSWDDISIQGTFFQKQVEEEGITKSRWTSPSSSLTPVMNCRPILTISKSHEALMLTPKELMSPFLTADQVETWVTQAVLGITGPPDLSDILKPEHGHAVDRDL
jgi:hypothetical protein